MRRMFIFACAGAMVMIASPAYAETEAGEGTGSSKRQACLAAKIDVANRISDRNGSITRSGECRCEYDAEYRYSERWFCQALSHWRPHPNLPRR